MVDQNNAFDRSSGVRRLWEHINSVILASCTAGPILAGLCSDQLAHRVVSLWPVITSALPTLAGIIGASHLIGHLDNKERKDGNDSQ